MRSPPWAYTEREYAWVVGHIMDLSQETLFYNPDSSPLAYRIKVAFKLRNMAKLGRKMVVPIDCTPKQTPCPKL